MEKCAINAEHACFWATDAAGGFPSKPLARQAAWGHGGMVFTSRRSPSYERPTTWSGGGTASLRSALGRLIPNFPPSAVGYRRDSTGACLQRTKGKIQSLGKLDLCGWALDSASMPIRRRFQAGWWGYLCQVAPRPSSCRSVLACRACRPRERRLRDLQGPDTSKAVVTLAPRPALPSAARILIIALTRDTHTCAPHDCQHLAYDCIHTPNSISSMPIRNPFRRGPGGVDVHDENQRPSARGQSEDTGFQRAKTTGSKPVEILEKEYKLSGACLLQPPFQRPLHEIMRSRHHRRQPLIRHRDQRFWRVPAGTSTQSSLRYDPESGESR